MMAANMVVQDDDRADLLDVLDDPMDHVDCADQVSGDNAPKTAGRGNTSVDVSAKRRIRVRKANPGAFIDDYVLYAATSDDCIVPAEGPVQNIRSLLTSARPANISIHAAYGLQSVNPDDVDDSDDFSVAVLSDGSRAFVTVLTKDGCQYLLGKGFVEILRSRNKYIDQTITTSLRYEPHWSCQQYPCSITDKCVKRICEAIAFYRVRETPEMESYIVSGSLKQLLERFPPS